MGDGHFYDILSLTRGRHCSGLTDKAFYMLTDYGVTMQRFRPSLRSLCALVRNADITSDV